MDKQDKPLSEWTLGEAMAECRGRAPTGSDAKEACVGCPLNGKICDVCEDGIFPLAPEDWKIDGETEAKTEREGLGPSPTGETEAPEVDVGADSKPARPRLAEVLGVEVGEKFRIDGFGKYWITPSGWLRSCTYEDYGSRSFDALSLAINHPKIIIRSRP